MAEKVNESGPFNLGTGVETTIKELVETIKHLTGFEGQIVWDTSRPDGQPRRFYDMTKFESALGYVPSTSLKDGLMKTIEWYGDNT
jgi:GDP-L-fucose synthase